MNKADILIYLKNDIDKLIEYCSSQEWLGYDPYDGLNSPLFKYSFFNRNKFFRILIIQFFKNSPINLRPLFLIRKEANSKGLALCLKSLVMIYKHNSEKKYLSYINHLINLLIKERATNNLKLWGYNFDWQSRAFFIKKHSPNFVVSYFVLDSFFELYKLTKEKKYKKIFIESCNVLIDKFLEKRGDKKHFKYVLNDKKVIHNVNLFGSSLMSKAFAITGDDRFKIVSEETLATSIDYQSDNGSWPYGIERMHSWIDSFHTCFNLLSFNDFILNTGIRVYEDKLVKGFKYFINNFFTKNYVIKYYDKKTYPIDIHSFAIGLITLIKLEKYLKDKEMIIKTYNHINKNFKSEKGTYYFRIYKFFKNKIPYMRWGQSWLLYSFVILYEYISNKTKNQIGFYSINKCKD